MSKHGYCCDRFAHEASNAVAPVAGGLLYPYLRAPSGQIEYKGDAWNVLGCCGGGCYVLTDLMFCPWCGSKLEPAERK